MTTTMNSAAGMVARQEAAFRQEVRTLSVAELRRRHPHSADSFDRMKADERAGVREVHPAFRRFKDFLLHMGPKPNGKWTLDRPDNPDPEYGPENARWATKREQANNRSNTKNLRGPDGRVLPLTVWAEITRQHPDAIRTRLRRGWTHEEAITGKRNPVAPTASAAAAPPAQDNPWPEGTPPRTIEICEPAYALFRRLFRAKYPAAPEWQSSRAAFMDWFIGRVVARKEREVEQRFPHWKDDAGMGYRPLDEFPAYRAMNHASEVRRLSYERLITAGGEAERIRPGKDAWA